MGLRSATLVVVVAELKFCEITAGHSLSGFQADGLGEDVEPRGGHGSVLQVVLLSRWSEAVALNGVDRAIQ